MRALVLAGVLGCPALAAADVRAFTETYEYSTQPEGTTSVQLWYTARRITWDRDYPEAFQHRIEIVQGVTEHLDVGTQTILVQSGRGGLLLDRVTLAARYRFADRAEWPVDLVIALEAGKVADRGDFPIDVRVVAARDFDRLTVAVNAVGNLHLGKDISGSVETDLAWAAGVTYQVHDKVRIGAETWGGTEDTGPKPPSDKISASAGPVLHFTASPRFWATATAGFGLTDAADVFLVHAILGIEI